VLAPVCDGDVLVGQFICVLPLATHYVLFAHPGIISVTHFSLTCEFRVI
jgi:hypothetical protein